MQDALHKAGHKYLKLLFVLALAGSSALFFAGAALPRPPPFVVVLVAVVLGVACEWAYFTFSCDLTESISEGHKGAIVVNFLYTLLGGGASWFLFTNAALHVGWAPVDDLLGLTRPQWAMILAGLVVIVIFVLSARRRRSSDQADLQSTARAVSLLLPNASDSERLRLLSEIASAASRSHPGSTSALPDPRALPTISAPAAQNGSASNGKTF